MKEFNTTAVCIPSKHYMVDLSERVKEIQSLVEAGKYFTINRARQYGKTTTLNALKKRIAEKYVVIALDFQRIDKDVFENGAVFSQAISRLIIDLHEFGNVEIPDTIIAAFEKINDSVTQKVKMDDLFRTFKRWIKIHLFQLFLLLMRLIVLQIIKSF